MKVWTARNVIKVKNKKALNIPNFKMHFFKE